MRKIIASTKIATAPALIGELAEHIRRGRFTVSDSLIAAALPDTDSVSAHSDSPMDLRSDWGLVQQERAHRSYRKAAALLDFAVPSFEISWGDVPFDYYSTTIDVLPFRNFICVVSALEVDRIYHFFETLNGSCRVLAFQKQGKEWIMLPCDMLIAMDLTFHIPSIHDAVDNSWRVSQLAIELLAIVNAPTAMILLPELDEGARRLNDQRRIRSARLIKRTHKIILQKGVTKVEVRSNAVRTPNGTPKAAHDRRGHLRWLKKTQKHIPVTASKVHGGSADPAEYNVVVQKP